MLTLYGICFLVGGVFVALSTLAGHDGADVEAEGISDWDHDTDFDHSIEMDLELVDPNKPEHLSRGAQRLGLLLGALLSLKFWTFGSCFFGLTGITLSLLTTLPATGVVWISGGVGLLAGGSVAGTLQYLRRHQANSLISATDVEGLVGTVEIPFDAQSRGRVRLWVKESLVDFTARTHYSGQLHPGDPVLVIEMQAGQVWVLPASDLHLPPPQLNP